MTKNILVVVAIMIMGFVFISKANAGVDLWSVSRVILTEQQQLTIDSDDDYDWHAQGLFTVLNAERVAVLRGRVCRDEQCIDVFEKYDIVALNEKVSVAEVFDANGTDWTVHIMDREKGSTQHMNLMFADPMEGTTHTLGLHLIEFDTDNDLLTIKGGVSLKTAIRTLMGR